jgi:GntR family transcriptional regulator
VYTDKHSEPWSGLAISQTDPRPLYLQVKEQIRRKVALGDWAPGQEIPSIRVLAAETRVSVITIKRAYLELELEGVIVTRQGKGSCVADTPALAPQLRTDELDAHLAAAWRAAETLGLTEDELIARLRAIAASTPTGNAS